MTRKDYILIANVMAYNAQAYTTGESPEDMHKNIAEDLADALAQDNPLFNREVFLKACGVEKNAYT